MQTMQMHTCHDERVWVKSNPNIGVTVADCATVMVHSAAGAVMQTMHLHSVHVARFFTVKLFSYLFSI